MPASDEQSSKEQSSSEDTPTRGESRGKRERSPKNDSKPNIERNDENDDGGDERTGRRTSKRPRRSTSSVKYVYSSNSENDDVRDDGSVGSDGDNANDDTEDAFDNGDEEEISSGDDSSEPTKSSKKQKRGTKESSKKSVDESFQCTHCGKAFKTRGGLQYHMEKRVCRLADGTPKATIQNTAKPRKKAEKVESWVEDLTCPHCKRVFKSMLGAKYHIEQKVCRKVSVTNMGDGKVQPFPSLDPGQQFVTPFGIVEVVKDDRVFPTAVFPDDIQDRHRKYKKIKASEDVRDLGRHAKRAAKLRVRRNAINALYEKDKANRRSVFDAYFGGDPEHIRSVINAKKALPSALSNRQASDPKEPEDSFPDRIVECIWITDKRSHVLNSGEASVKRDAEQPPKKLYLQRRLLKQLYDEGDSVFYCPDCGRQFHSSQSHKAHCLQKKCIQEAELKKEKREELQEKIEREAKDNVRFPEIRKFVKNQQPAPTIKRKWKKKKKAESSVYPEVVIGMGFKLVQKQKSTVNSNPFQPPPAPERKQERELDDILGDLKGVFKIQQRKANDQKYGSIYSEVYRALGFKHPGKRKGTNFGNNVEMRKRRKRNPKPKPPPPSKPLPPTIDVGALVDEIKSGRYPSIKVFEGNHADFCMLCKKGGTMFCCEFCNNVEHFECILTKFTIKEPEPDEDFMCHKCIGVILSRRARAEKRRLRKQAKNEMLKKEEPVVENDPSDGNEYPYMASQAREVNELVELLKDSQVRLRRSIETTKMNNIRRQVIAGVYPDEYACLSR